MHAVPGGPFASEKPIPDAIKANIERKFRLDQPLWRQYTDYAWGILRRFDLGPSYASTSRDVKEIIGDHLPVSAQLAGFAILIALIVGLPAGIIAAMNRNTIVDYASTAFVVLGLVLPSIVLGPLLVWAFALKLGWLPVATWGTPKHLILPAVTLGLPIAALAARMMRATLLQVLSEDYIRTARAKGLSPAAVVLRHALRNALPHVLAFLTPLFALLVTGSIVVEQIYAIPGLGEYFITSIGNRDYPVIMGTTLLVGSIIILANLAVDVVHTTLDPRVRHP
jgi:ABC-type dipeptide/oligopeptide/nickel transport system permease component